MLVADDMSAKVADFGESRRFDEHDENAHRRSQAEGCVEKYDETAVLTMTLVGQCAAYFYTVAEGLVPQRAF